MTITPAPAEINIAVMTKVGAKQTRIHLILLVSPTTQPQSIQLENSTKKIGIKIVGMVCVLNDCRAHAGNMTGQQIEETLEPQQ